MTLEFRRRFGVPAMFIGLTVAVVATVVIVRSVFSYDGMARRDFGSPARIAAIIGFFESSEGRPRTDFAEVPDDPDVFGFPETRVIPNSAIPKELVEAGWGTYGDPSGAAVISWQSVLAHYDEQQQLRAIEFYGSRYGALVSRDPALKPAMPGELRQLADAPVFITARITGDPD
jgi:hypothetical protein